MQSTSLTFILIYTLQSQQESVGSGQNLIFPPILDCVICHASYLTISTTNTHNKYYLHTYSHPTHGVTSHTQHYTALQQNELFPPNLFLLQCTRVLSVYHRRVESGENLISFYLETHCWRLGALEMENGGPRQSITVSIELSSRNSSRLVDNSFEKYRIHLVNWTSKKS